MGCGDRYDDDYTKEDIARWKAQHETEKKKVLEFVSKWLDDTSQLRTSKERGKLTIAYERAGYKAGTHIIIHEEPSPIRFYVPPEDLS